MEQEENVISIGEIFKVIFRRVWWVVGVTAAFLLIFVMVAQFWYNKNNQTYSVNYEMYFPGMNEGYYPDGTQYRLDSVVSVETLVKIRNSNEEFDNIDVEQMVQNDEISITKVAVTAEDSSTGVAQSYFTLNVSAKYFKNSDQAAAFIREVAAYPVNYALEVVQTLSHDDNLKIYDANYTDTFKKKIDQLTGQSNYLVDGYKDIANVVGSLYIVNGKTIAEYQKEVAAIFDETEVERIRLQIQTKKYDEEDFIEYGKFVENSNNKIELYNKQIQLNNKIVSAVEIKLDELLEKLNAMGQTIIAADVAEYINTIANYQDQNARLQDAIDILNELINDKSQEEVQQDINAILLSLDSYKEQLNEATTVYANVYKQFYNETCVVSFRSNKIAATGGINIILAALIGAVIGFVVVSIVIYIIDMPKYRRNKAAMLEGAQSDTEAELPEKDESKQ